MHGRASGRQGRRNSENEAIRTEMPTGLVNLFSFSFFFNLISKVIDLNLD